MIYNLDAHELDLPRPGIFRDVVELATTRIRGAAVIKLYRVSGPLRTRYLLFTAERLPDVTPLVFKELRDAGAADWDAFEREVRKDRDDG